MEFCVPLLPASTWAYGELVPLRGGRNAALEEGRRMKTMEWRFGSKESALGSRMEHSHPQWVLLSQPSGGSRVSLLIN